MRIIDIDDKRYQVIKEITTQDEDFINRLSDLYKERCSDFFLLKSQPNPAVDPHHLICRIIDDADYVELTPQKKKRQRKKKS